MSDRNAVYSALLDFAHVLVTTLSDATGAILAQIGDVVSETPDADDAEWWQHTGFASRPAVPTQGNSACDAVVLKSGSRDVIVATRDTRGLKIYGNLKDGESCVYASSGAARTLYKANGAIVHYTTSDNTESGTGVSAYFGPDKIQLVNQWGAITIDSNGITLTAGQSGLTLTPSGVATLAGQQVSVSGQLAAIAGQTATCVGRGAVPAGPPGAPALNSALVGTAVGTGGPVVGVVTPSTNVYLGV